MVGVDPGVQDRNRLPGADEAVRPDVVGADQRYAVGEIGAVRDVLLDAHHRGIGGEPAQRLRTRLERDQRQRREGLDVAVGRPAEPREDIAADALDGQALGVGLGGAERRVGAMRPAKLSVERELDDHAHRRALAALEELGHGGRIGARLGSFAGRRRCVALIAGRRGAGAGRIGAAERRQDDEREGEPDGARPASVAV